MKQEDVNAVREALVDEDWEEALDRMERIEAAQGNPRGLRARVVAVIIVVLTGALVATALTFHEPEILVLALGVAGSYVFSFLVYSQIDERLGGIQTFASMHLKFYIEKDKKG